MHARHLALPAVVLCVAFAACHDHHDDSRSPGTGSPGTPGAAPTIEGAWVVTSTPTNSSCGALNGMLENVTVLTVVQAGNDFDFTMEDDCGTAIPGGTGNVDPSGAVSFGATTSQPLNASCTLQITENWSGLARTSNDVFNGSNIINVAASQQPGQNNCGATLPCTVSSSFQARRCPPSGCVVTCTP